MDIHHATFFFVTAGISFKTRSPSLSSIYLETYFKKHCTQPPCRFPAWILNFGPNPSYRSQAILTPPSLAAGQYRGTPSPIIILFLQVQHYSAGDYLQYSLLVPIYGSQFLLQL